MKMPHHWLPIAALAVLTMVASCKKETTTTDTEDDNTTELTTHTDDQSRISIETDAVVYDASLGLESISGFSGYVLNATLPVCDATVTFDTTGTTKKMTITYNGSNCSGARTRTGSIVLSMPKGVYWRDAGAVVTISFQGLKITRTRDQKSITINGTHTITNESGGLLLNLATLRTITHTINSSDMSITFDNDSQRTWQVAKKRVFTYNNGLVITVTGNHADGGDSGIAVWGTNRFGHAFTTTITQPLVLKQDCNFRLTSGAIKHEGWATADVTFGLDVAGNPASCPGTGSYYYKLDWTGTAGKTHSSIAVY
jgi:hypothetical protein